MKISLKKITRYFKTDTQLYIEELNDYRQSLDNAIKSLEKNVQILELALAEHVALGKQLNQEKTIKQIRIESVNNIIKQYVKMGKDTAAREMIMEKMKEKQNLLGLYEIIDLHNQRIEEYKDRLKKAISALDNQNSNREAFIIKQQIAIQELKISEKLDKNNSKKHIERIQREILDKDTYKLFDLKEDEINDAQMDGKVEEELSYVKMNYSSNKL